MLNKQTLTRPSSFQYILFKHALCVGLAVTFAYIVNFYYSFSHSFWLILSTLLVCQVRRCAPLRQGIVCFAIIIFAVIVSSLLKEISKEYKLIYMYVSFLLIVCNLYFLIYQSSFRNVSLYMMLFFVISMFSMLTASASHFIIIDMAIGCFIGLACQYVIFPVDLEAEFSSGILPVLKSLHEYSPVLLDYLFNPESKEKDLLDKKNKIENAMQLESGVYPEWVFELGFNRGLRSGLRYFLISIEKITETFFSIQYIAWSEIDPEYLSDMKECIQSAMQKNQELLSILIEYFHAKQYGELKSDFTSDIVKLENALQSLLPGNLELLDISTDYLLLTSLVRDIKDLRELLLQLVMSLP